MTRAQALRALETALSDGQGLDKAARELIDASKPRPKTWSLKGKKFTPGLAKQTLRPSPLVLATFPCGYDVAFSCMTLRGHPDGFDLEVAKSFAREHFRWWFGHEPAHIDCRAIPYDEWTRYRMDRKYRNSPALDIRRAASNRVRHFERERCRRQALETHGRAAWLYLKAA